VTRDSRNAHCINLVRIAHVLRTVPALAG
jgi:hypothetical protein